jgi:hypothetical protein
VSGSVDRLLKAYPRAWRDRYGDELAALVEEQCAGSTRLPPAVVWSLLRGGLVERWRVLASSADLPDAEVRQRRGAALVLVAWTLFVLGGIDFAKYAEHWTDHVPVPQRHAPAGAFSLVQVGAALGVVLVVVAALLTLPALRGFVRRGGAPELRVRLRMPAGLTAATLLALGGIAVWAHHLTPARRNGADAAYAATAAAFSLLAATCLMSWTGFAVSLVARLELPGRVVRAEAGLAVALAALMGAMSVALVVWWTTMAARGSTFFAATASARSASALSAPMVTVAAIWVLALTIAAVGTGEVLRGRRGRLATS